MNDLNDLTEKRSDLFPLVRLTRVTVLVLVILCAFLGGSLIAAVAALGWKHALIGCLVGASLMSFIGIPLWLATILDHLEAHRS